MEKSTTLRTTSIHPAVADAVLSVARMRQIRLGQVCVSKACGDGKNTLEKEEITPSPHPAVADAGLSSEKHEINGRYSGFVPGRKEK